MLRAAFSIILTFKVQHDLNEAMRLKSVETCQRGDIGWHSASG